MQKSAGKTQILIDDLLNLFQGNEWRKSSILVDLNEIIEGILLDFKESIEEKNIIYSFIIYQLCFAYNFNWGNYF
jgi:hypothetical protein